MHWKSPGRITTGILSWIILRHVSRLTSGLSRNNLTFMRAVFIIHATYYFTLGNSKKKATIEPENEDIASSTSLQTLLFPSQLTAASITACLIAKLSFFPLQINSRASSLLLWIIKLATPGLLWTAFAETNDPIAESDPCALAAVTLAVSLGGSTNITAAGVILLMLTGGEALEEYALKRAGDGLRQLIQSFRLEGTVQRVGNGNDPTRSAQLIDVQQLIPGDIIQLAEGETIPADGVIVSNPSLCTSTSTTTSSPSTYTVMVDESAISGESGTVSKLLNDLVYSGTVVCCGTLTLRVERTVEKSMGGLIRNELSEALSDRRQAPMERSCADLARALTPIALSVAFLAYALRSIDPLRSLWTHHVVTTSKTALRSAILRKWEIVLSVLMAATPCPLSIGVPVAFLSARSTVTNAGITLKSGGALERLAKVTCVVLDKTGTLTTGKMKLVKSKWWFNNQLNKFLPMEDDAVTKIAIECVGAIERHSGSRHAVALAFIRAGQQQEQQRNQQQQRQETEKDNANQTNKNCTTKIPQKTKKIKQDFPGVSVLSTKSHPGKGVTGVLSTSIELLPGALYKIGVLPNDVVRVVSGSKKYVCHQVNTFCGSVEAATCIHNIAQTASVENQNSENPENKNNPPPLTGRFENVSVLICNNKVILSGKLYFIDPLRKSAIQFVSLLQRKYGLRVLLTSGDASPAFEKVAHQVGLIEKNKNYFHCLPDEKATLIKSLKVQGESVLMIGDGMNDAAALAAADVAIAVGSNDLVASVSDVTMNSNVNELQKVLGLLSLSRETLAVARRGVIGGMAMSTLQMVCAATGLVPPIVNAVLQEVVDLSTVIHSMISTPNLSKNILEEGYKKK